MRLRYGGGFRFGAEELFEVDLIAREGGGAPGKNTLASGNNATSPSANRTAAVEPNHRAAMAVPKMSRIICSKGFATKAARSTAKPSE